MANRTPVARGLGRARIQPVASPVDTYVRDQKGAGLSQLAESLKSVAPEVAKFSDVVAQQQSESQKAAGEQKARELFESGTSYKDAIKKGLITPDQSPWFQLGAKEQYGRVTAGRFSTDLQDAVEKNPQMQESTSVEDYDKFVSEYRKQWMEQNVGTDNRDLQFEHSFGSMADSFAENSRRQFVAQAGARLVKVVGDRHYGEVFTNARHELQMGTDHKLIGDAINLANERFTAMGGDPTVANRAVVQALGDLAQSTGDTTVLDILGHVKAGNQMLDARPWAQKMVQDVSHTIWEDKQSHHRADAVAVAEQRQAHSDAEVGDITSQWALSANPSRLDFSKRIAELAKTDWKAAQELTHFRSAITEANFASDTVAKQGALANIFKPVGDKDYVNVQTLVGMLNSRKINAQDFITLKSQIEQRDDAARREKNDAREHNPYTDPQFTKNMGELQRLITSGKPEEMWSPEVQLRAHRATAEFGRAWLDWRTGAGKDAGYSEVHQWLVATTESLNAEWAGDATKRAQNQPNIPRLDVLTPDARDRARKMANVLDAQTRSGNGLTDGQKAFLKANNITDIASFIKKYGDH